MYIFVEMRIPFTDININFIRTDKKVKAPAPEAKTEEFETVNKESQVISTEREQLAPPAKQKEDVDIELPMSGGRSSIPNGVNSLSWIMNEFSVINPEFNVELLKALDNLAIYNADLSLAVENIVALGNTEFEIEFPDTVNEAMATEMKAHIRAKGRSWYNYGEGMTSLCSDLLAQVALTGAVSAEIVPTIQLDGVKKVVMVAPKFIRFSYDVLLDEFMPYQVVNHALSLGATSLNGLHALNPLTYKYIALRRLNENPYAIPPFLAALEHLGIERDMVGNFANIMKRAGTLGFLEVLLTKPKQFPGENDLVYQQRCANFLNASLPEAEKSLGKGFALGFEGTHKFELQGTQNNAKGAKDLFELNNTAKMAGLKQSPMMFGRNYSTTETLARVMMTIMTTNVAGYQKTVGAFLRELFLIDLVLNGYPITTLEVCFKPAMINDQLKDAQADQIKIQNVTNKRNAGFISQTQAAQELGYEKPFSEKPLYQPTGSPVDQPQANDNKKTSPGNNSNSLSGFQVALGIHIPEFDYCDHKLCGCSKDHKRPAFSFSNPNDKGDFESRYNKKIKTGYSKAARKSAAQVGKQLSELGNGATVESVVDKVMYTLYKNWKVNFTGTQKNVITKFVEEAYTFFRQDKSPLGNLPAIPEAVFGLIDHRTITYFKNSDELYLGKFITDSDTRQAITAYIKEEYLANNLPIGTKEGMRLFRSKFSDVLMGEDWKIDRIISTTMNKLRNYGAVNYMGQAEVEEFQWVSLHDRIVCPYCEELSGKRFLVSTAVDKIESFVKAEPQFVKQESPFVTSLFQKPEDMKGLTAAELQAKGLVTAPAHPACRCSMIAVL